MPLHRDILWIGRQWAVTGHGMQLIDQRLEGAFDIEVNRLWDDGLIESLRAKAWLKAEDFEKALTVARTRHAQPSGTAPPAAPVPEPEPIAPPLPLAEAKAPQLETPQPEAPVAVQGSEPQVRESPPPVTIEASGHEAPGLQMRIEGGAKFARPWRVWMKKS